MSYRPEEYPPNRSDPEAAARFAFVLETGKRELAESAILDPRARVGRADLIRIDYYHQLVSPLNPERPWRIERTPGKSIAEGNIVDPSTYANWDAPGGPLESIDLATQAGLHFTEMIKQNLRDPNSVSDPRIRLVIQSLARLNPHLVGATAALHDEGRLVTHTQSNDAIGYGLLKKMGVRPDIRLNVPDPTVMWVLRDESMDDRIANMDPIAVIVRMADEMGKRVPGTNRLYTLLDCLNYDWQTWAENYAKRPFSGRASELPFRNNLQLHVDNEGRYFRALASWITKVSTLTMDDLTDSLGGILNPTLRPI